MRSTSRALTVGLAAAALTLTGGAASATSRAASTSGVGWAQTDSNGAQSRANHHETTLTPSTIHGIRYRRSIVATPGTGDGCETPGVATPVLTNGHVVAVVNGRLSTYSAADGHLLWSVDLDPTDSTNYDSLAIAHGVVVVGGDDCGSVSDPNGVEQAYAEASGAALWSAPTTPDGGALSRLVVSGRSVVATGDSEGSGQMTSVRALGTGDVVWFTTTGSCDASANVVVVDQKVIYAHCDQDDENPVLEADDLATGAVDWSRSGAWSVERGDTDALTSHHLLAVAPSGNLDDLVPQTGATRHHFAGADHSLVVGSSRLFATCMTDQVCAYRLGTAAKLWSAFDSSSLGAEAAGLLYLSDGQILNAGSGAFVRQIGNGDQAAWLAVGNGRVAMTDGDRLIDLYGLAGS